MLQRPNPAEVAREFERQLKSDLSITVVRRDAVPQARVRELSFSPDICLRRGDELIFVHLLATGEIPTWIRRASRQIRKDLTVLLLTTDSKNKGAAETAGEVAEEAQRLGFGLAIATVNGPLLVFPPRFQPSRPRRSSIEVGHVPNWLYEKAAAGVAISQRLKEILQTFQARYRRATSKTSISYNGECRILTDLAESIAAADPRLFFPLGRLQALREFEQGRANLGARDHFFHTFNNLFLGLVVLDGLFANRSHTEFPDSLILANRNRSRLNLWESIWFLTALFHDPGYIPEDFWSLLSFGYGFQHDRSGDSSLPAEVREKIENWWNTEWLRAREQLRLVYRSLREHVGETHGLGRLAPISAFDRATRRAYFGGDKAGHSLLSGLTLINRCLSDRTAPHSHYQRATALSACNIACLSMLFHDQYCRETMSGAQVNPIPFQYLPYAATLMFVDAIQDDRRDVSTSRFRQHGVLDSLQVDQANGLVNARVMLSNVPIRFWPNKIAEYHSVMNWINPGSVIKFVIEYVR
jgi:hypothetical protein